MNIVVTIATNQIPVVLQPDGSLTYNAGANIDGDGANGQAGGLPCYAPAVYTGQTLDKLANGGHPGNWWGVVTDNGQPNGTPIQQKPTDPCPNAYVSTTSLLLPAPDGSVLPDSSPFKYVDAATVPFVVLPPEVISAVKPIVMGCKCIVTYNGTAVAAVVADQGPGGQIGEISVACAVAAGIPIGTARDPIDGRIYPANGGGAPYPTVSYQIFPGVIAVVNGVAYPLQPS